MESVFLKLLHMSMSAGWLTAAVILFRLIFKKAPKNMRCILWSLVGIRLLCPFSLKSALSLVPNPESLSQNVLHTALPDQSRTAAPVSQLAAGPEGQKTPELSELSRTVTVNSPDAAHPLLTACTFIWLAGIAAFLIYLLISSLLLYRRVREGMRLRDNIWLCDRINTPFILGIFRPRIYLPSGISTQCADYALAHEKAHLARFDHWRKPLGYLLLAVYWFHPAIWAAYILFCKDIELACDEKVIHDFDIQSKKAYSSALLDLSIRHHAFAACPPAFSEGNIKERVKEVLKYKKPAYWIILAASVCCIALAVCFMTDPISGQTTATKNAENAQSASLKTAAMQNTDSSQENTEAAADSEIYAFLTDWARTYISRDGKALSKMMSERLFKDFGFQPDSNDYSFGFSSPWPWDNEHDYVIQNITEDTAEILYYAHTSDPHITVWKQQLTFSTENGSRKITKSSMHWFDAIASKAEFTEAYPAIQNTMMDYLKNGLGEALEKNTREYSEDLYQTLTSPETAAVFLLNLSDDTKKAGVHLKSIDSQSRHAVVEAIFPEDNTSVEISMYSPKQGGIWIPQDAE